MSDLVIEFVLLAVGTLERDLTTNGVVHVDLTIEVVLPGGRVGICQETGSTCEQNENKVAASCQAGVFW